MDVNYFITIHSLYSSYRDFPLLKIHDRTLPSVGFRFLENLDLSRKISFKITHSIKVSDGSV